MAALGWLKKVAERGPLGWSAAGRLWNGYVTSLCNSDTALRLAGRPAIMDGRIRIGL